MAESGVNKTREEGGQSGRSIYRNLEPTKEVQRFIWEIKDFLAVWELATKTASNDKMMLTFEIGRTIGHSTEITASLFAPDLFHVPETAGDPEHSDLEHKTVSLYINQPPSLKRPTFVKYNLIILRPDGTRVKEIREIKMINLQEEHGVYSRYQRPIFDISELTDPENQILDPKDGSLYIDFEMTLYAKESREFLKRTYDDMELPKSSSEECMSKALEYMSKKQRYADAVLLTNDGRTLKVLRNVLAARSPVFEKMFKTGMTENATGVVKIDDISYEALEIVVKYIYTGKLDEKWIDYMTEVINAAEKYDLPFIKKIGDADLIKKVTNDNAMEMHKFAQIHQLKTAIVDISEYIRINIVTILAPTDAQDTETD